jgi:hypothetical protein
MSLNPLVHEQLVAFICSACDRAQPDHPAVYPAPDSPLRCQHCGAESQMYDNRLPAAWDHTRVALRWWD